MKKIFPFIILFIIGGVCGYILAQQKEKSEIYNQDQLIKKHIEETLKMEQELFDSIFDDKFFSKDYDPFEEIENFRKRMMKLFIHPKYADIFNNSFSEWLNSKIFSQDKELDGILIKTEEDENKYIIEIENTNKSNSNLSIDVKPDHIKISYEKNDLKQKEDSNSKVSTSSYIKSVKYFTLPPHIRGKDHTVEKNDDKIIIKFIKK